MRLYGLVGYPLEHSFSRDYFIQKWEKENITDAAFSNFLLQDIRQFPEILASNPALRGLSVTIPHKTSVIPLLDDVDAIAAEVDAVNSIVIRAGRTVGYNTDIIGFEKSFLPGLRSHHQSALILGNGGAARAVQHVCLKAGLGILHACRRPAAENEIGWDEITPELLASVQVVINCTPLGMFPDFASCPPIPFDAVHEGHYFYDLVYNPASTKFLLSAAARGAQTKNGLEMLVTQAEESWKLWNEGL